MKSLLHILILLLILHLVTWELSAQPANDDCSGAFDVPVSDFEENVILIGGDTRGATASSIPDQVCSDIFYTDDIFFKFRTASVIPLEGLIIKAYFDKTQPTDVPAIGIAVYESCDSMESPLLCFNSNDPAENHFEISGFCLKTNHTYFIRVWSMGADTSTEGTLRMGIYINRPKERILWWETFDGGIEVNGWTTYGTCALASQNHNAYFKYLPEGLIDSGSYVAAGTKIIGSSFCDGAVGVDSDYNDSGGVVETGPCLTPGTKFLVSPVLFSGDWKVSGVSLIWTQALRQYESTFFISYRIRDVGNNWEDWTDLEVNTEFRISGDYFSNNVQQHFLQGASGHDSIQIRFIYYDNYYFWAIDDVKLVEIKCNDARLEPGNFAFTPFQKIPEDQVYPFPAVIDIFNAGACTLNGTSLNLSIQNIQTSEIVYNETIHYVNILPDTFANHILFPKLIDLPKVPADYVATYSVTHDSTDSYPKDDTMSYRFSVGGNIFALENNFTGFYSTESIFETASSYAFGNYFRPQENAVVNHITWAIANPAEVANETVKTLLIQWTDINNDQIVQSSERTIIGHNSYIFSGIEENPLFINTILENIAHPGEPIIMQRGLGYIALIEYTTSELNGPQLNLLINDSQDYAELQLSMDSVYVHGLSDHQIYFSVYGYSPDGNLTNIDYQVKDLNPNDFLFFPGNDIIPLVRINVSSADTTNTKSELSSDNIITVYPNPVSDEIYVKMEFKNPYKDIQLRLLNNIGQIVFTKTITTTFTDHIEAVSVSSLAVGNYMLQVETSEGQRSLPVIVVR